MSIQQALAFAIHYLNQPSVKKNVKNAFGTVIFACGWLQVHDTLSSFFEKRTDPSPMTINHVILISAKTSLILSAMTSPPGTFLISKIANRFFSSTSLERVFGPNTIFAVNPWHPRHVVSIASVMLALPNLIQSLLMNQDSCRAWLSEKGLRVLDWIALEN